MIRIEVIIEKSIFIHVKHNRCFMNDFNASNDKNKYIEGFDIASVPELSDSARSKVQVSLLLKDAVDVLSKVNFSSTIDARLCLFYLANGRYDLPNDIVKVDLNDKEWKTIEGRDRLLTNDNYLQVLQAEPRFARIVKESYGGYYRIARGHIEAMKAKMERLNGKVFYRPGDLIYIDRDRMTMEISDMCKMLELLKENDFDINKVSVPLSIYAHVGIYIGNNEVVHFAGTGDLEGKRTIHICSVKEFLHSEITHKTFKDIYIMHFPGDGRRPYKLYPDTSKLKFNPAHIDAFETFDFSDFKCFSNAETVKRAKLMLEDKTYNDYDFLHNNCEHLAFYCKTGKKFSVQASNLQAIIDNYRNMLDSIAEVPKELKEVLSYFNRLRF